MALGIPTIVITSVVNPEVIIPRMPRSKVIAIVAPCPNTTPCHSHSLSQGSRCLITGQDENDFSRTPPCMSAPEIGSRILQELESLVPSQ